MRLVKWSSTSSYCDAEASVTSTLAMSPRRLTGVRWRTASSTRSRSGSSASAWRRPAIVSSWSIARCSTFTGSSVNAREPLAPQRLLQVAQVRQHMAGLAVLDQQRLQGQVPQAQRFAATDRLGRGRVLHARDIEHHVPLQPDALEFQRPAEEAADPSQRMKVPAWRWRCACRGWRFGLRAWAWVSAAVVRGRACWSRRGGGPGAMGEA